MRRLKTFRENIADQTDTWYLCDAKDKVLGRFASNVAKVLLGKNKPTYTKGLSPRNFVVVTNALQICVTGNKAEEKTFFTHSGYLGGEKITSYKEMSEKHPVRIVEHAIRGMLPKNTLGKQLMRNLKVFAGDYHNHQAQKPELLEFKGVEIRG